MLAIFSFALPGVEADAAAARERSRAPAAAAPDYRNRPDVDAFIEALVRNDGFARHELVELFAKVKKQPQVIASMSRPLLQPPKWFEYAPPFLSAERVDAGVAFWLANEELLARVHADYGVPPEVIVAIVGVETFYGRYLGRHRVIDALATLAFDYPRRAEFFSRELREFLLLTRDLAVSPLVPKGSFAGAMGVPQFMPGSYRSYGIDYDQDRRVDLWRSAPDIVASVAHYLARHDWLPGKPVLEAARMEPSAMEALLRKLDGGISERRPLSTWRRDGVFAERPVDAADSDVVAVVLLEQPGGATYWLSFNNFYVITRYNRSRLYAAAVWELARAIAAKRQAGSPGSGIGLPAVAPAATPGSPPATGPVDARTSVPLSPPAGVPAAVPASRAPAQ